MKNIIPFSRLTNQGLSTCVDNTLQAIDSCGIVSLKQDENVLALIGNYDNYVISLGKQLTNEYTAELNRAFDKVSTVLAVFRKSTNMLINSEIEEERLLAERINNHFRSLDRGWGKTLRKDQRGYLVNLIAEYSKPEYQTPMSGTALPVLFNKTIEAASEYAIALKNSNEKSKEIKECESTCSLRNPLIDSYNKCYYYIQFKGLYSTNEPQWKALLNSIDALHEKELTRLRTKKTVAENAAEQSKAQPNLAPAAMSNTTTDTHAV